MKCKCCTYRKMVLKLKKLWTNSRAKDKDIAYTVDSLFSFFKFSDADTPFYEEIFLYFLVSQSHFVELSSVGF